MRFFNFWNSETYFFFQWLTNSSMASPDALIARAYEILEDTEDESHQELRVFDDVSLSLKNAIAGLLNEMLDEIKGNHANAVGCPGLYESTLADHPETPGDYGLEFLFIPFLNHALDQIETGVVAEALLIRAGKWAPDTTIPEIKGPDTEDESPGAEVPQ